MKQLILFILFICSQAYSAKEFNSNDLYNALNKFFNAINRYLSPLGIKNEKILKRTLNKVCSAINENPQVNLELREKLIFARLTYNDEKKMYKRFKDVIHENMNKNMSEEDLILIGWTNLREDEITSDTTKYFLMDVLNIKEESVLRAPLKIAFGICNEIK